jgi:hypothetical protein
MASVLTLYSTVVTIRTSCFNIKKLFVFRPHSVADVCSV